MPNNLQWQMAPMQNTQGQPMQKEQVRQMLGEVLQNQVNGFFRLGGNNFNGAQAALTNLFRQSRGARERLVSSDLNDYVRLLSSVKDSNRFDEWWERGSLRFPPSPVEINNRWNSHRDTDSIKDLKYDVNYPHPLELLQGLGHMMNPGAHENDFQDSVDFIE